MYRNNRFIDFASVLRQIPNAFAVINGSNKYPKIYGTILFYQTRFGVIVAAEIAGLPTAGQCQSPVFGFHIHKGSSCTGNTSDPFANALTHYDPHTCSHPYHAGDLPPLFGANGRAFSVFLTDRFSVRELIGKTVIIHSAPDDFTTQPSGNSGEKIACGEIRTVRI